MEFKTLNIGSNIPSVGYGVYRETEEECEAGVAAALEEGYRLIDTAAAYNNEAAVGRAIRNSGIPRDQLFITTKLIRNISREDAKAEFEHSLEALGLDYIDMYMTHMPLGRVLDCLEVLADLKEQGLIRAIGVANCSASKLADIIVNTGVTPSVDQVEVNPFHQQDALLEYAAEKGILIEAWGPLAQGRKDLYTNPVLQEIASKYGKTVAQVVLRWHLDRGEIVIPKSTHRERIQQNIDLFDFRLDEDDMKRIAVLNEPGRADNVEDPHLVEMLCSKWFDNTDRNR